MDALDIAKIALDALDKYADEKGLSDLVNTQLIDLDDFAPQTDTYNLVLMANFLDREVIEKTKNALKSGGVFIVETYMQDADNEKTDSAEKNLLKPNELKDIFSSFDVLYYNEFENEAYEIYDMKKQVIVAKKQKQ